MTVLVCISCLMSGGTEIQTLSLVESLVEAGHRVVVVCYYTYLPAMVERFREAGADVRLLSEANAVPRGKKAQLQLVWQGLSKVVKEVHPDVAHVQYQAPGAFAVLFLKLLGVKKILITHHGDCKEYSPRGLKLLRLVTANVTAFQFITMRAESNVFGCGSMFAGTLPRKRGNHFTIYNSIPNHIEILTSPRTPLAEGTPLTVGVVSRLEPVKGMDLVVPAFSEFLKSRPDAKLLVVGDGSQRSLMERQAAELGIAHRVEFTGRKQQSELQGYYDAIDILLMPSRSEGLGLTAIEGMARGCVPVVSDRGGLPEVVTPATGCVHRADDPADMARKMVEASRNLHQLSREGVKRAATFALANYKQNIKTLYEKL